MQSCAMAYDEVTEDNVYLCVGHPPRRDIENIVKWMLNDHFSVAYNSILASALYSELLTVTSDMQLQPGTPCLLLS